MRIGRLKTRIAIERAERVRDAAGGFGKEWGVVHRCWANVIPEKGAEGIQTQQNKATRQLSFLIRYREDVLPTDRISLKGKVYQIVYVDTVTWDQRWTKIVAVETVGEVR